MFVVKAEVAPNQKRIWLTANYALKRVGEKIPGASFSDKGGPHWSLTLSLDNCYLLRETFKQELRIGSGLVAWAKEAIAQGAYLKELGSTASVALEHLYDRRPELADAVAGRPYQTVGAKFIAEGQHTLLADTPGLGKTIEVLAGIVESGVPGPYLFVAPMTATRVVWGREIERWLPGAKAITVPEGKSERDAVLNAVAKHAGPNTYVIVHPYMMRTSTVWRCKECRSETKIKAFKELSCGHDPRKAPPVSTATFPQLFQVEWGVVVSDEADQCLLHTNKNGSQTRKGMMLLKVREGDGMRIAATGTPFRGRPHLLWGTLNWLRPKEFPAFWPWVETHYNITKGYQGAMTIGTLKREDLLYKTLDRVMLRRTKSEVAPDLPPKLYLDNRLPGEENQGQPAGIWLPMDPKQDKAYAEMKEMAYAAVHDGELDAIGVLAEMTRLQQLATGYGRMTPEGKYLPALPSNKFEWLKQRLHEAGYPSDPQFKVVIVSRFTSVLDLFAEELKVPHVMITGKVTGTHRDEAVDKFNSPKWQGVCFLNTKAGGSAITLDGADEMIFLDRTHIPDDQEQAEERINNRRPEEKVLQRRYAYLCSEGTIDYDIALVNVQREDGSKTILDTRRGVTDWALKALGAV